jgi:hypothetical protein
MILLQIDPACFPILKLECDAPRAVDVNRVARWAMTAQTVKVEARQVQIRDLGRRVQSIEYQHSATLEIRPNPSASAFLEKLTQALVLPGPYHTPTVNPALSFVNP